MKLLVAPPDRFALEAALALRAEGDEVLAVAVGDEPVESALRHALAMGVDRAARVWDEELAGVWAEEPDAASLDELALAALLAAVARSERADLILCRAQSPALDDDVTGIALAGLLDLPHAADVFAVECHDERLTLQRRLDGGRAELLRLALPALLTIRTGSNAPRQPDLRAVKRARARSISVLGLDELGLDTNALRASAGAHVVALQERPPGRSPRPIGDSAAEIAARIVELARERIVS